MAEDYEIIIRPKSGWIPFNIRELYGFKDLLTFLVWRDIKVRYKQTILGVVWVIFQPLLSMILFSLLFGKLAGIPSDGIAYPLFAYSGLLFWNYFSATLSSTANSLIANSSLVTKVYFPRLIIPASASLSGLLDLVISSVFFAGMLVFYHATPHIALMAIGPLLLSAVFVLAVGCGLWLSALNVEYRDFQHVIPFFVQIWMFATPVIYPSSLLPERFRWLIYLNPMCGYIETLRSTAIGNQPVNLTSLTIAITVTILIFISGLFYFRKVESSFADII